MFKLLAVLALVGACVAHRFKGGHYRQTKDKDDYAYKSSSWEEAHEYDECPEFDDSYEEDAEGSGDTAKNGMHHFMSRHHPKLIEDTCINVDAGPVCPNFSREESGHCGFETVTIPKGWWMAADIDMADEMGVRNAYKEKIYYGYREPNKIRFMIPVIVKWHLDEDGNRVKGKLAMYVPTEYQEYPIASTTEKVKIEEWPETKVYFRPYGGYRDDAAFGTQFEHLRKALDKAGLSYKDDEEWEAGYTYLRYGRQRIEAMVIAN